MSCANPRSGEGGTVSRPVALPASSRGRGWNQRNATERPAFLDVLVCLRGIAERKFLVDDDREFPVRHARDVLGDGAARSVVLVFEAPSRIRNTA